MKSTHLLHTGPIGQYSSSETVYSNIPMQIILSSWETSKESRSIYVSFEYKYLQEPCHNNEFAFKYRDLVILKVPWHLWYAYL